MARLDRRTEFALTLPSSGFGLALCVQISALGWLLTEKFGLRLDQVGLIWAAGPLSGLLGQLWVGRASDRTWWLGGRRRPYIMLAGILTSLCLILLPTLEALSTLNFLPSLVTLAAITTLLLDVSINLGLGPARALVADLTDPGTERTRAFASLQTVSGAIGVAAYALGGAIGNERLFWMGAIGVLVFTLLPAFFLKEPRELAVPDSAPAEESSRSSLLPYLAHAASWLGMQTLFVYAIGFVKERIAADAGQTLSFGFAVLNTLGFLLPRLVIEKAARRLGRRRTHSLCLLAMAASLLAGAWYARSESSFYWTMAGAGIGWASLLCLPIAILSERSRRGGAGLQMGLFNVSIVLPQLAVSLVLGAWVEASASKALVLQISAAGAGASALLWAFVRR